jgi:hypothetical protein
MKYKHVGTIPKLKEGQEHFCIRYTGYGVGFRTVIAAKDAAEANQIFDKHYPFAVRKSTKKGAY